jgi:hypothetical protein
MVVVLVQVLGLLLEVLVVLQLVEHLLILALVLLELMEVEVECVVLPQLLLL